MIKESDSRITTESCNSESMSYYIMIRQTIHGLDNLVSTIIHQSVTIITGALTLGMGLSTIITDPWGRVFLGIMTVIAFAITWGSHKRIQLYADILAEAVGVAERLENSLLTNDSIRITKQIQRKVERAGMTDMSIYLRGIMAFYLIEFASAVYLVLSPFFGWEI